MKSSTLMLLAALAAAYFIFGRQGQQAAQRPPLVPPGTPGSTGQPGWVKPASTIASGLLELGGNIASELKGMDGMVPETHLGHMASIGAYGDLGGTLYGGI